MELKVPLEENPESGELGHLSFITFSLTRANQYFRKLLPVSVRP